MPLELKRLYQVISLLELLPTLFQLDDILAAVKRTASDIMEVMEIFITMIFRQSYVHGRLLEMVSMPKI